MRYFRSLISAILTAVAIAAGAACSLSPSLAQEPGQTSGEIDLDLRSFAASTGRSSTDLNSVSFRLEAPVGSFAAMNFCAKRDRGEYLTQEASLDTRWGSNSFSAGIVRMPFGIYDEQETYASGLINYPLARNDFGYNSVDWGVAGVKWLGGGPKLQIEAAGFGGRSAGVWNNQQPVDGVAGRVQTYFGSVILGASRWDGYYDFTYDDEAYHNDVHLSGVDLRYTRSHLLMRGEYIAGTEANEYSRGWYMDAYYRLPALEKWTLVGRIEELKPGDNLADGRQLTLGARYTADSVWIYSVNWSRNNMDSAYPYGWTPYTGKSGQVMLQVFRRVDF